MWKVSSEKVSSENPKSKKTISKSNYFIIIFPHEINPIIQIKLLRDFILMNGS